MEYEYENGGCLRSVFRSFVCVTLSLLLALHVYAYFWGPAREPLDGDFSDIRYVVTQLTRGLTEVNHKHERLKGEMERLSSALPAVAAAAERAKDALQPSARRTGQQALDVHDYDRQVADYALESAGGRVLSTGDTAEHVIYESPVGWALHVFTALVCRECLGARAMIRPGTLPGECWAFKGSHGEATIRLLGTVQITGFSVEHIPAHISPTREISSAPRLIQIEGLEFRSDPYPHDFGSFEYDKEGKPIQYFEVQHPSTKGYNIVRVRVLTNWGHPVYTCVYRVRVHGDLVTGQAPRTTTASDDADLRIENE
ncbi:SUN domain-containing protein 2-like [Ostrinia furnacalis]|uniref:SUN domain-containing protein 2-like n=1 Tax=Ostrinia furnacalis TaxID=93504 RepID=UPI001038B082|nr:SUN domain-containing protein 2-like [Ostrinia furnacalis]